MKNSSSLYQLNSLCGEGDASSQPPARSRDLEAALPWAALGTGETLLFKPFDTCCETGWGDCGPGRPWASVPLTVLPRHAGSPALWAPHES